MRRHWVGIIWAVATWTVVVGGAAGDPVPRGEHPRPDFRRDRWACLNGTWQFRFDPEDRGLEEKWQAAASEGFERRIVVPFGWQSKLSGIADTSGQKIGWYRRRVKVPESFRGKHVWLRFDAVDWEARVWVNGREVGRHEGGYTPFEFEITELAEPGGQATIVVRAHDATDPELPTGKQGGRWYTPTSGIWQTVWLEARPAQYVDRLRLTPSYRRRQWWLEVELEAAGPDGPVQVEIASPDSSVQKHRASIELQGGRGRLETALEVSSPKPWTPEDPHLYDLEIRLAGSDGATDTVHTYFGLRTIGRGKHGDLPHEAILLNGLPIYLRGALDQSFNPEGIYTAPSDEFMRRDMEIAKSAGFNFLRIHIKSEEPRRLYWADRLGVLIMEDMPCTWRQSPRARRAWEQTMRATIERDRNHPAVIAWCLFNESWGLGGDGFKSDRDAQDWVLRMWTEVKQELDPSRLVEDNSPCRQDHVRSDINSWHFYLDDYPLARQHIEGVVKNTRPDSPFNYVPGRLQGAAPLMNSEYGAVSARGGDRDVSWGFRYLTTLLRREGIIQGYVYTELSDVEWEHNGVVNYDRSAKQFGYDGFVPEMTIADLQGADFVGYDGPPAFEINPGGEFTVRVFVSHFSRRTSEPTLRWQIVGTDNRGRPVVTDPQTMRVAWDPYRVTFQQPVRARAPSRRSLVGALVLELLDEEGRRIAANFMNLIVRRLPSEDFPPGQPQPSTDCPRVEVLGPRQVAVRFDPREFASLRTDEPGWDWLDNRGKLYAYGSCEVEYHLALPEFVRNAIPTQVALMAELATKADVQRLDWPSVRRPLDHPQTQQRQYPGEVSVRLLDHPLWQFELPDDPADARGVLSHEAQYQRGSYGYLVRKRSDLTRNVSLREALRDKPVVPLVFRAAGKGHGLSIYGAGLGRYLIDPTMVIQTARDLGHPAGWTSEESVTVHRLLDRSRRAEGLRTGESGGHSWRYTTAKPASDWTRPEFDDSSWQTGSGGFGKGGSPAVRFRTPWTTSDIWLRTELQLPARPARMVLRCFHDDDVEIYVNGKQLLRAAGRTPDYQQRVLGKADRDLFQEGRNLVAAHCRQTGGGQGIDLGLTWIEVGRKP